MPIDVFSLPLSSMNTKWKEAYGSASLNQKFAGVIAPGIYRGLRLAADPLAGDRTVLIQADQNTGDHVAVYQNADGYSITYRDSGSGDITVSLASYSNVVVLVCVYINYALSVDTTGSFRIYTQSEYNVLSSDIKNALVVLGTVTVPVSGAIPDANISLQNRTLASTNLSRGSILNAPLVRNHGFELGEANAIYPRSSVFWDKSFTAGSATWKTGTAVVNSGMKSIELGITSGPVTGDLSQQIGVETSEGELHLVSVSVQQNTTISSGAFVFFMEWADVNDALLSTTTVNLDGGAADTSFRTVSTIVEAPAGAVTLRTVGIRATSLSPLVTGTFAYIDNVDVFVEPADTKHPYPFDQAFRRKLASTDLKILDPIGIYSDQSAAVRFDKSTPSGEGQLIIEPVNSSNLPPALGLLGRLYKLGAGLLSSATDAIKARMEADISVVAGAQFTLLWQAARAGELVGAYTQGAMRIYGNSSGGFLQTVNARWDGSNWNKDIAGQEAYKFDVSTSRIGQFYQVAGTTTWTDASWVTLTQSASSGMNLAMTILDDVTLTIDKNVKVQGAGRYKHGTRTMHLPAVAGKFTSGATYIINAGAIECTTAFPTLWIPFPLEGNKRITAVRWRVQDNSSGPTKFSLDFLEIIDFSASSINRPSFDNVLSSGSGSLQTVTFPALNPFTTTTGYGYAATVVVNIGSAPTTLLWVEVDYDDL